MTKVIGFREVLNKHFTDVNVPKNWQVQDFNEHHDYDADCFFQLNVKKIRSKKHKVYDFISSSGKPYLVIESNLFRKNSFPITNAQNFFYRIGWWHYLRNGVFNNKNCPPDRWSKIKKLQNLDIKKWRCSGNYVLLCLQKPGDSSLNNLYETFNSYEDWIRYAIQTIQTFTDRPIMLRPHIKGSRKLNFNQFLSDKVFLSETWDKRTIYEGGEGLMHDFQKAYAVVAYNSNVLVESTCEGIPSFPLSDDSVVWEVSNRIQQIENPNLNIDRSQWLFNSAYMIWSIPEIKNGLAWQHLKGVYF